MKKLTAFLLATWYVAGAHAGEPSPTAVVLNDFHLAGNLTNGQATFSLTATARVDSPQGASLELLSGPLALTEIPPHTGWTIRPGQDRYIIQFNRRGVFPIRLNFAAAVRQQEGREQIAFRVAPAALQPVTLTGLSPETEIEIQGAARPQRSGDAFVSYLPASGLVQMSWKEARREGESKLFYATEMLSQVSVSPGLLRQVALLDFKIMQGELNHVAILLQGEGEVTRVQGEHVLAWNLERLPRSGERRLSIRFNQAQKDHFALQIHLQTALGAFPQATDVIKLRPEDATRFAGYFRIVNEGAVRLEVLQATGLSQISPEQFPESDVSRAALGVTGNQRFAYRFSGADYLLRIQADQVVPELTVSEVVAYRLGDNELSIDGEIELEVREAPVRELLLRVPRNYAVARLTASGLADYFLQELEGQPEAELRLVFSQPVSGRQVIELRLERGKPLGESRWILPPIHVAKAKSLRGQFAVAADAGYRLSTERSQGVTEMATAFFPRKVPGMQAAFRLNDGSWQAVIQVERLPQTIQADAFHLFSIGEGIAYGSSLINYVISGAPLSTFKVQLSGEYYNVEFTGKDLRNWQKVEDGYLIQLHTPVTGPYALLATYERPFKPQGDTLTFSGARPIDAGSEQGHTLIVSAYQFQVKPAEVSPGLISVEPGEVPSEYRLFFDAPVLAAYRYVSRPFNLRLALTPLAQGDSLSQIVDRAILNTRITKEGQILTDVRYLIKSRGHSHFRMSLPAGAELWSASVNGTAVVPVTDAGGNLIPLPQVADPNALLSLEFKMAAKTPTTDHIRLIPPTVEVPIMLAEWKLEPDTGRRLVYHDGALKPIGGVEDASGFSQIRRMFVAGQARGVSLWLTLLAGCLIAALIARSWITCVTGAAPGLRRVIGIVLGSLAFALTLVCLVGLLDAAEHQRSLNPREISFLMPIQMAGAAPVVEVANIADQDSLSTMLVSLWPAWFTLPLWLCAGLSGRTNNRRLCWIAGWALLAWALLRLPNGGSAFLSAMGVFLVLQVFLPVFALAVKWISERRPKVQPDTSKAIVSTAMTVFLVGFVSLASSTKARASSESSRSPAASAAASDFSGPVAAEVIQDVRVNERFVNASAKIRWEAEKGQSLPLLRETAVLTGISYPSNVLKLVQARAQQGGEESRLSALPHFVTELVASRRGIFEIELRYELRVGSRQEASGFVVPLQPGLVNRLKLTLVSSEMEVSSPQAVAMDHSEQGTNTVVTLGLSPAAETWVGWKPKHRDLRQEKPVFYAEVAQLYVPQAGVIEGLHQVSVRPAQGEIDELVFDIPAQANITDVADGTISAAQTNSPPLVASWRFDPDARKLRVTLAAPQSRPFTLLVRSQLPTGPLPLERSLGLLRLNGAAEQIGLLGVATGKEVQLDAVGGNGLSAINLEDFPAALAQGQQSQGGPVTVRRAFRYADLGATALLKVSTVEPDVRVEMQDTLSLGEDRTVLAAQAVVDISRAGIFRLSFILPSGLDVESISGSALSHWTELNSAAGRVITLNLNGKTEGKQTFSITLAGPGVKGTNSWAVPQVVLREATKQHGTLLVVPEQGLSLQASATEGVIQLDPEKSGIKQKGVLAFRVSHVPHLLTLAIEQVQAWIQVTSLQQATVSEAQVSIAANLQYQIDNTGLKVFRLLLPANAEAVRFQGEQVADFIPDPGAVTNGLQPWVVRLQRKVIGRYLLSTAFRIPLAENVQQIGLRGVQAVDATAHRGFVTVQSGGRLGLRIESPPAALQPTESQSIPRPLQQGLPPAVPDFSYRLVDGDFQLPIKFERHQATKLLPARVKSVAFESVVSDQGEMLTQVRLELLPGDKRLLNLTLPKEARFWFAFANENGVWPWREQARILIPFEQESRREKPMTVEFLYSCQVGSLRGRSLDLALVAPKFDLPLENVTWRVSLSDRWKLKDWAGSFQLQAQQTVAPALAVDLQNYLQVEAAQLRDRTRQAEELLATGNSALTQGDPQQARRAFQAAYGLSSHDAAFNEDARVQLHNIKLQEALIGLNVRQGATAEQGALAGKVRELRTGKQIAYTQQDAKDLIDRNTADENAAYLRLAERLIQQQDAATSSPSALRARLPSQTLLLTFQRAVVVDSWADLQIRLRGSPSTSSGWLVRSSILAGSVLFLLVINWAAKRSSLPAPAQA